MDAIATILKRELNRLIIDGIKYERVEGEEFEMRLFETEESLAISITAFVDFPRPEQIEMRRFGGTADTEP